MWYILDGNTTVCLIQSEDREVHGLDTDKQFLIQYFGPTSTNPFTHTNRKSFGVLILEICDPVQQKVHLVGQVYSEIMSKIVCQI